MEAVLSGEATAGANGRVLVVSVRPFLAQRRRSPSREGGHAERRAGAWGTETTEHLVPGDGCGPALMGVRFPS